MSEEKDKEVVLAEGEITVENGWKMMAKVYVNKIFYCADIFVNFTPLNFEVVKLRDDCYESYESEVFIKEIIRLLTENGHLDKNKNYRLERAELGMQGYDYSVFEALMDLDNGICISTEFSEALGCINQSKIDDAECTRKRSEMYSAAFNSDDFDKVFATVEYFIRHHSCNKIVKEIVKKYWSAKSKEELIEEITSPSESEGDILFEVISAMHIDNLKRLLIRCHVAIDPIG